MSDALLIYQDGTERNMAVPVPLPELLRVPDYFPGPLPPPWEEIKILHFRRDPMSPDECPIFRQTLDYQYL